MLTSNDGFTSDGAPLTVLRDFFLIRETLEAYVNTEGELRVRAIKKGQADGDTSADNPEDAKGNQPY